jgi:hypothetical protein
LQEGGAKKKACKKETPFSWALPTPALFLKKEGQKLHHKSLCEHTYKSKFARTFRPCKFFFKSFWKGL